MTGPATLVEFLARRLVEQPDEVRVEEADEDGALLLRLHVASGDIGRVIGRRGRIVRALRSVARAASARTDRRVLLEIAEE